MRSVTVAQQARLVPARCASAAQPACSWFMCQRVRDSELTEELLPHQRGLQDGASNDGSEKDQACYPISADVA